MLLILVSLCGLISCVSQHKYLLVHLSCHSITKTKQGPFRRAPWWPDVEERAGGAARRQFGCRRARRRGSAAGRPRPDNRWVVAGRGGERRRRWSWTDGVAARL